jgi:hypothetical protein
MVSTAVCRVLALLLPISGALPGYEMTGGSPLEVNAGGTSFNSLARLSATQAIQCYADYSSGKSVGTCSVLTLSGEAVEAGDKVVFNSDETLEVSVVGFSETQALVCYWDEANLKRLTCKSLTISGTDVSVGDAFEVNSAAEETPYAAARLSAGVGAVCWSYRGDGSPHTDGAGVCNKMTLNDEGLITKGADYFFDELHTSQDFSIQPFATDSALLCWSAEGAGTCTVLTLSSGGDDFTQRGSGVFYQSAAAYYEGLAVASLTSTEGVVCYADGVDNNTLQCKLLTVEGSNLIAASEAVVVNTDPTSWVTATTLTDPEGEAGILVCYATEEGGNVNGLEFKGMGTCNIVGTIGGEDGALGAAPASVVNEPATEYTALATLDLNYAILCYSGFGAGQGQCRALGMAPTTTTSSVSTTTSATQTATTITETTTSPHTTTMTSWTGTTGTEITATTELSASVSCACVSVAAALATVLGAAA